MLEALCIAIGLACWDGERPPTTAPVKIETPKLVRPTLKRPKLKAPKVRPAQMYDAGCEVQPPDNLKPIYWAAAKRTPGVTDCELGKQGKAECEECWAKGDYSIKSPAGAIGVGQFLPKTAKELKLDPHDPKESIFGQARYVKWCRSGWTPDLGGRTPKDIRSLGLCCYNFGRAACFRNQSKHGWTLYLEAKPHIPGETRGYVYKNEGW